MHEQNLADRERVLGADHPDTLRTRNNLAVAYQEAAGPPKRSPCTSSQVETRNRIVNLLIRRSEHIVQDRPSRSVCWADIPELSVRDRRCPAAWQQSSERNGTDPRPSAFQAGHIPSCCVSRCERGWVLPIR